MKARFGTLRAVAEYLGKSERTVWRMVEDGRLPKPVPGFGYDWDEIKAAINVRRQQPSGANK